MLKTLITSLLILLVSACSVNTASKDTSASVTENDNIVTTKTETKAKAKTQLVHNEYGLPVNTQYQEAAKLIRSGQREKGIIALQKIINKYPEHKDTMQLLKRLDTPFVSTIAKVEDYIEKWLKRPISTIKALTIKVPEKPKFPNPSTFNKGEFETTKQFESRLDSENNKYKQKIENLKQTYINKVKAYNDAVRNYNKKVRWEYRSRQEQLVTMRPRLLNIALSEALGNPKINNARYNADKEIFYGELLSEDGVVSYNIKIPVALSEARAFKNNIQNAVISAKLNINKGVVSLSEVDIKNLGKSYTAFIVDNNSFFNYSKIGHNTDTAVNISKVDEFLGNPKIEDAKYYVDEEAFYAKLSSESGSVSYNIKIPVASSEAQAFKNNIQNAIINAELNINNGMVSLSEVNIKNLGKSYNAFIVDNDSASKHDKTSNNIGVKAISIYDVDIETIDELIVDNIIINNRDYFQKLD